ncbi:MAG: response regulator [Elusimicrobiales bacterium]|nr:response regulator [Elusimicrobiales bacterium]
MKKILVIDDDVIFRHLVKELLEENSYMVDTAKDGLEGFEKLKKEKFDLVILDVNMPNMNGFETLNKIREDEEIFDIPVIMLTVKSMIEDQIQGFEYGADDYIAKPFENEVLIARVKTILEKKT